MGEIMNGLREFVLRTTKQMRLVSSGDLTTHQISEAQANGTFWVDEPTGLGFALVPWELTTNKDRARELEYIQRIVDAAQ